MDISYIMIFLACISFIFLVGKFFVIPLKMVIRIIGSSVIGGCIIFIVNILGEIIGFHIGINVVTTIVVGLLGIPRSHITYYFGNVSIKLKKVDFCGIIFLSKKRRKTL